MLQKSLTVKDNFGVPPILPRVAFAVEDEAASDPESEAEAQAEQQSESVLPDNAMLADLGSVGESNEQCYAFGTCSEASSTLGISGWTCDPTRGHAGCGGGAKANE